MTLTAFWIGVTAALAAGLGVSLFIIRRREGGSAGVDVHVSLEDMRAIGELSVFKVMTKEIVTAKDHWLGEWGKKYLEWLTTSKKMAMIFEFDIDFRYDLRHPDFTISVGPGDECRIVMPRCAYGINIRDITFYDEQRSRFMPWLIPELLTSVFGSGFNEEDRNHLKEEARRQAEALASDLVGRLRSEVESSARETMKAVARGFGVVSLSVEFGDRKAEQVSVDYGA